MPPPLHARSAPRPRVAGPSSRGAHRPESAAVRLLCPAAPEPDEPFTRIALAACGHEARSALRQACATPLRSADPAECFDWRIPAPDGWRGVHLLLALGMPSATAWRQLARSAPVAVALHRWQWRVADGSFRSTAQAHAAVARTLAEALLVRGHVCVDFEDVAGILPRATACAVGRGAGAQRIEHALQAANGAAEPSWRRAGAALVLITFSAGGGKLRESRLAMDRVREQVAPEAHVIFATTVDPSLPAEAARLSVLSG